MNGYVYSYVYDFNPDSQFFGFLTSYSIFLYSPSTPIVILNLLSLITTPSLKI